MWLFYSLIYVVLLMVVSVFNKKVLSNRNDFFTMGAYHFTFGAILFAPMFIHQIITVGVSSTNLGDIGILLLYCFANVVTMLLSYVALEKGEMSLYLPLRATAPLFVMVFAAITLGEEITAPVIIGTVLIVGGSIVMTQISKKNFMDRKTIILGFLSAIGLATVLVSAKHVYNVYSISEGLFAVYFSSAIALGIIYFVRIFRKRITFSKTWKDYRIMVVPAIISFFGSVTSTMAIKLGDVSIVTPIFRLEILLGIVVGWFIFKEKALGKKIVGGSLILSGVISLISIKKD